MPRSGQYIGREVTKQGHTGRTVLLKTSSNFLGPILAGIVKVIFVHLINTPCMIICITLAKILGVNYSCGDGAELKILFFSNFRFCLNFEHMK